MSAADLPTRAREVLLDTLGDDDFGTWELLWVLGAQLPDMPDDELRAVARTALGGLVVEGLAEIRRGRPLHDGGPARIVDASELDAPDAWEPAGDQPSYLSAGLTAAGEEAYYAFLHRQASERPGAG